MICPECKGPVEQLRRKQGGGNPRVFCSRICQVKHRKKQLLTKNRKYQTSWARKNRAHLREIGKLRDHNLKRKYGISEAEWEGLFQKQGRRCAICGIDKPRSKIGWHTDHDKITKKVRGILCENCNRGLGMYEEDILFLRRAAAYLGIHQGIITNGGLQPIIKPFSTRGIHNGLSFGLSYAGYDIRLDQNVKLEAHQFILASTLEYFDMPIDAMAVIHDKSSLARRGLQVFNTILEPGWRGYLTLELVNHSKVTINLKSGDPVAQAIFYSLDKPTDRPYDGKYQDQPRGPQVAI